MNQMSDFLYFVCCTNTWNEQTDSNHTSFLIKF